MQKKILALFIILLIFSLPFSLAVNFNLQYDRNGNLIQDIDKRYEYNTFNQLSRVLDNANNVLEEYTYDSDGQRLKKVEHLANGQLQTTYYVSKNLVRVVNAQGTVDTYYYYDDFGNLLYRKDSDGQKYYYHPDHLGSTTLVTNLQGQVVEETSYLPFGETVEGGHDRYLYTGQEKDNSGLYYYGARYYNPVLKKFTQPDTVLPDVYNPQALNRYSYVLNNPYKYTDPEGHNPLLLGMAIGGILGAAIDMINQIYHGASIFDNSMDWGSVGGSALIGAGAGLAGGAGYVVGGSGILAGELAGVASGVTNQVLNNVASNSPITENVGMAGGIGAGVGGVIAIGSAIFSNLGKNIVGTSSNAISNINSGFSSEDSLLTHFEKHGYQMGYTNQKAYQEGARKFLTGNPQIGTAEMIRSSDNALVRYQFGTQKFGVISADKTEIKTFFKLDGDPVKNYNYYLRQVAR